MDSKNSSPNVLTTDETKILAAIADRIFPKTDTPGAVEIGAVHYIDIALAGDYAPLVPLYRQGLRMVNRFAQEKFGRVFCQLTEAQKDADLLRAETILQDAFATDVRPAIQEWRASKGLPTDPLKAFREGGYLQRITKERAARNSQSVSSYA